MNTFLLSLTLLLPATALSAELQGSSLHRPFNHVSGQEKSRVASITADARLVLASLLTRSDPVVFGRSDPLLEQD